MIVPLHSRVRPGTLAGILQQAGISADELRGLLQRPIERAMRMRMTSLVPSPISRTLASR